MEISIVGEFNFKKCHTLLCETEGAKTFKINKTRSKSNDTPSQVCTSNQRYKINRQLCCGYQYNSSKRLKRRNSFEILHSSPETVPSPHKAPQSIKGFQSTRVFRIYQSTNQPPTQPIKNKNKIESNQKYSMLPRASTHQNAGSPVNSSTLTDLHQTGNRQHIQQLFILRACTDSAPCSYRSCYRCSCCCPGWHTYSTRGSTGNTDDDCPSNPRSLGRGLHGAGAHSHGGHGLLPTPAHTPAHTPALQL
jgi:hypothetical protein